MHVIDQPQAPGVFHHVTAEDAGELRAFLVESGATPVVGWRFGGGEGGEEWPVTAIRDGRDGGAARGGQLLAVSGAEVAPIEIDGRRMGSAVLTRAGRFAYLGGVEPADGEASRSEQARSVLERIERLLERAGMDFSHLVRTWLYMDDILSWYGDFNAVRNRFFEERGVFDRMLPASTGIGAPNPSGAAMVAGAVALVPRDDSVRVRAVESPLQCPAAEYRSSFSRAVEVVGPGGRTLHVSGTASIDGEGNTVHVGDTAAQIERTVDVVGAILESRGLDFTDVSRAVAYFKSLDDAALFDRSCRARGIAIGPLVRLQADVCRDELLFEIEVDAVGSPSPSD